MQADKSIAFRVHANLAHLVLLPILAPATTQATNVWSHFTGSVGAVCPGCFKPLHIGCWGRGSRITLCLQAKWADTRDRCDDRHSGPQPPLHASTGNAQSCSRIPMPHRSSQIGIICSYPSSYHSMQLPVELCVDASCVCSTSMHVYICLQCLCWHCVT